MQSDATLVREHSDTPERTAEAQRLIREAMYEQALGRLTLAERDRVMELLSFAVPAMLAKPEESDAVPPAHDAGPR